MGVCGPVLPGGQAVIDKKKRKSLECQCQKQASLLLPFPSIVLTPLNIQPVVVVRGLKRRHDAALTNFVGCFFLLCLISFFLELTILKNDAAKGKT